MKSTSKEKVDSILFFTEESIDLILDFLDIFGVNFIKSMESDINKSVLPLKKKLHDLWRCDNSSLKNLSKHLVSFNPNLSVSQIHDVQKCLLLFDTFRALKEEKNCKQFNQYKDYLQYRKYKADRILQEFLSDNETVKSIGHFLNIFCKSTLFSMGDNDFQIENTHIERALTDKKEQLVKLIRASANLKNDYAMKIIYYNLLLVYLSGRGTSFLTDTRQMHPVGRRVANHNEKIRKILEEQGIFNALKYTKTHDFIICSRLEKVYLELGYYLEALDKILKGFDKTVISGHSRLPNLKGNLDQVLRNIEKEKAKNRKANDAHSIIQALSKEKSLKKIAGYCEYIIKENPKKLADEIYPLAQAIKNRLDECKDQAVGKTTFQTFTIKMHTKEELKFLLLGDEGLGPCMASDNENGFIEILLYRIDDAVLIPVVMDNNTHRPVALVWLYLAQMTYKSEIVLVSDFFEMSPKVDSYTRKILINELLFFIHQYLLDNPGINGFYMNTIEHFLWNNLNKYLNGYPLINIDLCDKVGGSFLSSRDYFGLRDNFGSTASIYHLESLRQTRFHKFDAKVLMNDRIVDSKEVISVHDFINNEIHKLKESKTETPLSLPQIANQLIFKNFYILKYFFEEPFKNQELSKLISLKCQNINSISGLRKSNLITSCQNTGKLPYEDSKLNTQEKLGK